MTYTKGISLDVAKPMPAKSIQATYIKITYYQIHSHPCAYRIIYLCSRDR